MLHYIHFNTNLDLYLKLVVSHIGIFSGNAWSPQILCFFGIIVKPFVIGTEPVDVTVMHVWV